MPWMQELFSYEAFGIDNSTNIIEIYRDSVQKLTKWEICELS